MTEKLTKELMEAWLSNEEDEFNVESFRRKHEIDTDSDNFYKVLARWRQEGKLKRLRRGWYRKVEQVKPITWWEGEQGEPLPIKFPHGIDDDSSFGFDDSIEVYPGDSILIAGVSNQGKTAFALNFMVNNMHLFEGTRLMVNEYKPVRFRKRMSRFTWVDIWNGGSPKFETIPVTKNHEDYIKANYQNIIDWILLRGEFWNISGLIEDLQIQLRKGIILAVLQKTRGKDYGTGGEWGEQLPALYATIDPPGKLTVKKVKSWKEGSINPEGKMFGFDIVDGGSKFHNIREVKNCPKCKGFYGNKWCNQCHGKGYVELEGF